MNKWIEVYKIKNIKDFNYVKGIKILHLNGESNTLFYSSGYFSNHIVDYPISWIVNENNVFLIVDPYIKDTTAIITDVFIDDNLLVKSLSTILNTENKK